MRQKQLVGVLKFGGTSVGSGERIRRVAAIIADTLQEPEGLFPVVVVSAMSGVTDQLLRIARSACLHEDEACAEELASLRQRHLEAAEQVMPEGSERDQLLRDINDMLNSLAQDVKNLRQSTKNDHMVHLRTAAVASWGERLSILLVAAANNVIGVQAKPIKQEIIITSHPAYDSSQPFGVVVGADPLPEETCANAHALVDPLVQQRRQPG